MLLSVDSIQKMGGYTGGPVKRSVSWKQGGETVTAEVYVRPMSYHTAVNDIVSANDSRTMVVARRLSACLCDEDGAPLFRLCDITGFDDEGKPVLVKDQNTGEMVERGAMSADLTNALLALVGEVSGLGKKKPKKNSAQKKLSGTN